METIKFKVNKVPYSTKIKFSNGIFEFSFKWNRFSDRFYVDLYDNSGNLIHENEMIQYGVPLWFPIMEDTNGNLNESFPDKWITPLSQTGEERICNRNNLGSTVFLTLQERTEINEGIDVILYE